MKLFKIEELKEAQPAACGRSPCEAEAGCASFSSSILKSFTAATASIQKDLTLGAGVADGNQRSDSHPFGTASKQDANYDL